jgi:hypothetical protein
MGRPYVRESAGGIASGRSPGEPRLTIGRAGRGGVDEPPLASVIPSARTPALAIRTSAMGAVLALSITRSAASDRPAANAAARPATVSRIGDHRASVTGRRKCSGMPFVTEQMRLITAPKLGWRWPRYVCSTPSGTSHSPQ